MRKCYFFLSIQFYQKCINLPEIVTNNTYKINYLFFFSLFDALYDHLYCNELPIICPHFLDCVEYL